MFRIPGLRWWDHVPPFHLAANSRGLLLTAWAVLVLGCRGLDALGDRAGGRPWGVMVASGLATVVLLGLLAAWLIPEAFRRSVPPSTWPWFRDYLVRSTFVAGLGLAGLLAWLLIPAARRASPIGLGLLAFGELLATASGLNPQVAPATFYPESPLCRLLSEKVGDGRVCGLFGALPPNLAMMYGLRDVRGYDAVDADPFVELVLAIRGHVGPPHAITWQLSRGPSPIFDLLGVRAFITPIPRPEFGEPVPLAGRYVYTNPRALPRAFIPRRVVIAPDPGKRLIRLGDPSFDPRAEVLIAGSTTDLPHGEMRGSASIASEQSDRVEILAECPGPAVVVLADSWAEGWSVTVDEKPAEALRADHALRAVQVPAGSHRIAWSYRPRAVYGGLACGAFGLAGVVILTIGVARGTRS